MDNLMVTIVVLSCVIGFIAITWVLIHTFSKSINGKEHIEKYMSEKYGDDWLEQCMQGLRNPEVRKSIADELKLK